MRLGLGFFAVIIAGITFYFDYKRGWDETKDYTFWTVIVYFIINSILTIWIWGIERGKVFVGALDDSLVNTRIHSHSCGNAYTLPDYHSFQCHQAHANL